MLVARAGGSWQDAEGFVVPAIRLPRRSHAGDREEAPAGESRSLMDHGSNSRLSGSSSSVPLVFGFNCNRIAGDRIRERWRRESIFRKSRMCGFLGLCGPDLALNSPSQRLDMLQELFADIALGIDERARDIIVDKDGGVGFSDQGIQNCLCFYDVLADHYGREPGNGKRILDLIVKLWSQSFASHIFALLFHKWLFEAPPENSESQLRFASALVQGATKVFWIDVQTNTRQFFSLFHYLFVDVALVPSRLDKIPLQARRDLFLLLSRFIFFYNLVDRFESFLKHFPEFPNTFLVGGPADIFVIELTDQLQKLKVEPVLLHYLSNIRTLQGLELRMTTSTRLKACLYSFTSPGGPMYPTRAVRHAAWDALDFLFPVGRYPRHVISLFFRLLYPWYWPSSCWNFIVSCVQAIVYSVLRLIFSSWDKMRRPKDL